MGNERTYKGITTTGNFMSQGEAAELKRCVSCGAVGNANLCPKCFALHLDALDMHTDGLFSVLIDLHKHGILNNLLMQKNVQTEAPKPNG